MAENTNHDEEEINQKLYKWFTLPLINFFIYTLITLFCCSNSPRSPIRNGIWTAWNFMFTGVEYLLLPLGISPTTSGSSTSTWLMSKWINLIWTSSTRWSSCRIFHGSSSDRSSSSMSRGIMTNSWDLEALLLSSHGGVKYEKQIEEEEEEDGR